MDKIELRVVDHDGVAVDRHWHAVFGMAGGTIGRSGQNKLIISDPDASVARVHAMVRLDSEGAFVANLSERDPIWVADQPVRSGQEVALTLGARIRIGAYTLAAVAPGTFRGTGLARCSRAGACQRSICSGCDALSTLNAIGSLAGHGNPAATDPAAPRS